MNQGFAIRPLVVLVSDFARSWGFWSFRRDLVVRVGRGSNFFFPSEILQRECPPKVWRELAWSTPIGRWEAGRKI